MCAALPPRTESVAAGIEAAVTKFGGIRGAVNCAGVGTPTRVISSKGQVHSLEQFNKVR